MAPSGGQRGEVCLLYDREGFRIGWPELSRFINTLGGLERRTMTGYTALYARVSTADQSFDRQKEETWNYAVDDLGVELGSIEVYIRVYRLTSD